MPPMMVAPEREVPGISAKHCAKPTLSASSQVIARVLSTLGLRGFSFHQKNDHAADDERERHRHGMEQVAT